MIERVPVVSVVIASKGRPALLADVLDDIQRQTIQPAHLVVSVPGQDDLPPTLPAGVAVVHADGASAQRNAGLAAAPDATHVFFFDDDSVIREDYLENAMRIFDAHSEVVAITGRVLLDGAASEEITRSVAVRALADSSRASTDKWEPSRELYGCNFGYRQVGEQFDERLPLYSWLEDHDLARRLMKHGQLARISDCVIVHLGVKSGGRTAHRRLGYSQVMNPVYLWRKGSFPLWLMLHEIGPRTAKNFVLAVRGPESSWRRARVRGNLTAVLDIVRGRITPERIVDLPAS